MAAAAVTPGFAPTVSAALAAVLTPIARKSISIALTDTSRNDRFRHPCGRLLVMSGSLDAQQRAIRAVLSIVALLILALS